MLFLSLAMKVTKPVSARPSVAPFDLTGLDRTNLVSQRIAGSAPLHVVLEAIPLGVVRLRAAFDSAGAGTLRHQPLLG